MLQVLGTFLSIIGANLVLRAIEATLPNSVAWGIRRWLDFWAWSRTNRVPVRERLAEIELDFHEHYLFEVSRGCGPTRSTLRALGFIVWEILRVPATACTADRLSAETDSSARGLLYRAARRAVSIMEPRPVLSPAEISIRVMPLIAIFVVSIKYILDFTRAPASDFTIILAVATRASTCVFILLFVIYAILNVDFRRWGVVRRSKLSDMTILISGYMYSFGIVFSDLIVLPVEQFNWLARTMTLMGAVTLTSYPLAVYFGNRIHARKRHGKT